MKTRKKRKKGKDIEVKDEIKLYLTPFVFAATQIVGIVFIELLFIHCTPPLLF